MDALSKMKGMSHQNLMDVLDELNTNLKYRALTIPTFVISDTPEQVRFTATVKYLNNGIFKSKGALNNIAFTATTHDITADADSVQEACYLLCLAAGGAATLTMGDIASGSGNALLPEIPEDLTPIGYVRIAVEAGAVDFNATTDSLADTWITDTFVNLGFLSPRFDAEQ